MTLTPIIMRNPLQMMEPTFYDDVGIYGNDPILDPMGHGSHGLKQQQQRSNLHLDLNSLNQPSLNPQPQHQRYHNLNSFASISGKKTNHNNNKIQQVPTLPCPVLSSPDFEKLMLSGQPTYPGYFHTGVVELKGVTEEQEEFSKGFENALNELHHSDSSQESGSYHGATYTNLEPPGSVQSTESLFGTGLLHIKDEPQTVPSVSSSPPMSPIDMETQERIKLERKRQRNRVAASKCRKRKLERISRLEDKVRILKGENTELNQAVNRLKEHVCRLKEQVMDHVHSGCQIMAGPGPVVFWEEDLF